MKQMLARLVLSPFVAWGTIVWGFLFAIFVTPLLIFVTIEWLTQLAKGEDQTFHAAWMLYWEDSLAQTISQQFRHII